LVELLVGVLLGVLVSDEVPDGLGVADGVVLRLAVLVVVGVGVADRVCVLVAVGV